MAKPVYGLTGGIACGKSTVARMFEELGVGVVDADLVAREIVAPGEEALRLIVEAFGDDVLNEDGTLARKVLGERVFGAPKELAKLNAITHPRIAARAMHKLMELQQTEAPYLLYEAAILIESGGHKNFPGLIVVAVEEQTQLARLMARDQAGEAGARARIASQLPLAEKIALADWVIHNDGSVEETRRAVEALHERLLAQASAA